MKKILIILLLGSLLTGCNSIYNVSGPQVYEVHYSNTPIKVDGKLNEAIWKKAKALTFKPIPRSLCTENGTVKILWDNKYVYVGAVFRDSDIVQLSKQDWRHYYRTGDLIEIFLKPAEKRYYWELYATPNGLKNSLFFFSGGRAGLYNRSRYRIKEMLVAATCNGTLNNEKDYDKEWVVEIAIPVKDLEKQGDKIIPGKVWSFLIGRYNYSIHLDRKELTRTGTPRSNNFHHYRSWDKLKFINP